MKPILQSRIFTALAAVMLFSFSISVRADGTWTGGGASVNWSDNNNWGGSAPSYGTLTFNTGGTQGTTSSDNSITAMNKLLWTGSLSWTLNQGGSTVLSVFDNGGTQAKVENQSSGLVTINLPITFAANNGSPPNPFGEINAVSGDLLFGTGTLTVNGSSCNGIKLFGGGHVVTFNNTVSASSKWFGITTSGTGNTINIGGSFTATNFFVMNNGTLNLNSGGSLTTAVRLGGDFGNTGNQDQTKSGTFNLTVAAGGQTFSGVVNSTSGNTSGALVVNSQNTSATNTLSGHIALDSALKITQSAGGTLNITQAHTDGATNTTGTDIKGNTLTLAPAGTGTIIHGGTIYNSTGTGGVTMTGAGTNIYSAAHAYTGDTLVNAGTLEIISGGSANGSIIRIGDTAANSPTAALAAGSGASFTSTLVVRPSASGTQGSRTIAGIDASGTATISGSVFLDADATVNAVGGGTLAFTGTQFDLKNQTLTVNIAGAVTMSSSTVIQNSTGSGKLVKSGTGTLTLSGASTYSGNTTISSGTLALGSSGSINSTPQISIAAGATYDVSAINAYALSGSTALTASGTGTVVGTSAAAIQGASGGTVNLGSRPIALTFDGANPALYISQGTLSLNGNAFTVNKAAALAVGTYTIVQQASGNITSAGVYTVSGTAIGAGKTGTISVSGGSVILTIQNTTATTLTRTAGASPSTYGDSLTFHAVVSPDPGNGSTITFKTNGVAFGTATTTAGAADLTTSALSYSGGSAYTVTANFGGNAANAASSGTLSGGQQVNQRALSVTANNDTKTYGQTKTYGAGSTAFSSSGLQNSETIGTVTITASGGTAATDGTNTYSLTPSAATGGTFTAGNYSTTYNAGTLTVNPLTVSLTGSRGYDGTTNAAAAILSVANVVGSDNVTVASGTGGLADSSIGTQAITSLGTLALGGIQASNYTLAGASGSVTITQANTTVMLSSLSNPAGYLDNLTFTANVTPSDATGSVTFYNGATPFSTNTLVSGMATSVGLNTLPRGTNTITVVYGGDVNYLASSNSLAQVVTNHPPVANNVGYYRGPVNTFKFRLSDLLTNTSDADGDPVALVSFSTSTNGITLTTNGGFNMYYNTSFVNDQLTYTVSDGFGGSTTGTITLTSQAFLTGQNASVSVAGSTATVSFAGIPGYNYSVQRSTNLVDWATILTTNTPSNGLFKCVDDFSDLGVVPSSAYYRLEYNP